jgi:hypothetical protein
MIALPESCHDCTFSGTYQDVRTGELHDYCFVQLTYHDAEPSYNAETCVWYAKLFNVEVK